MRSKRLWLLVIIPLALFAWAYQAASWRPKLVGVQEVSPSFVRTTTSGLWPFGSWLLISPDGKYLASVAVLKGHDSLSLWALDKNEKLWQLTPKNRRRVPLAFAPDSQTLALVTADGRLGFSDVSVILVDAATGKQRGPQMLASRDTQFLQSTAFLTPRELVISTNQRTTIADTKSGKAVGKWGFDSATFHEDPKMMLNAQSHVSADGKTVLALANGKSDTRVFVYDSQTGKLRGQWTYPRVFRNPRLSPDGKLWAMQQEKNSIWEIYDAVTGQKIWWEFVSVEDGRWWDWNTNSQHIVNSFGGYVTIFNARQGTHIAELPALNLSQVLVVDPKGNYFYTLDPTGKIQRWRAR